MVLKDYFINGRFKIRKKVEAKYGFTRPFTKDEKRILKKEIDQRMWQKIRARGRYNFRKIKFIKHLVRLRVPGHSIKGVSIPGSKLIRYVKHKEIREASLKYFKAKQRERKRLAKTSVKLERKRRSLRKNGN